MAAPAKLLFVVVDGHGLAYRHYHATKTVPLSTRDGEPTGATMGFTRALMEIIFRVQPDYLAVAFDAGFSGRETLYGEYKSHRAAMPQDMDVQVTRMKEVVRAFNVPLLEIEGYEADDVIGTIARQAASQGAHVRVFTGDKDLFQLIDDDIDVYLQRTQHGSDELYDEAVFRAKYGFAPAHIVDLKALQGDASDNIPGVPGIGGGTASALVQAYGAVENIYANLATIPPSRSLTRKRLDALRDHHADALLSKTLATIQTDVPVALMLDACVTRDFDSARVEALLTQLEFRTLLEALRNGGAVPVRAPQTVTGATASDVDDDAPFNDDLLGMDVADRTEFAVPDQAELRVVVVRDRAALNALVGTLRAAACIAFDTETTSLDVMSANLVGVALAVDEVTGFYIPLGHIDDVAEQLPVDDVVAALRPAMTDPSIPKVAHHASFDLVMLRRYGLDVTPITFDTMIAEWVRDSDSRTLGLKGLAMTPGLLSERGVQLTEITALIGTGKGQVAFSAVPVGKAAPYAAADATTTFALVQPLDVRLDDNARRIFTEIEMPLVPVLATMQMNGVLLDTTALADMSTMLRDRLAQIEQEIFASVGGYGPFNINSPKQLNDLLFGKLGLSPRGIKKTTHGYSTAADVLDRLYEDTGNEVLRRILDHRELGKLKSTYVDALPTMINARTGRVHTSYNQAGSTTGRLSSSNPNLQNIPIRTDLGREVRRAFIAPPGHSLLAVDYSQVELRIMAHIANEPFLRQAFLEGQDIHAATAARVFGVPFDAITKGQRNFAKRVNFGVMYGMGAFRLARESNLTLAEAEGFIGTYFERLPRVRDYIESTKRQLYEAGYVETLEGRRRTFLGLEKMSRNDRARVEREAINMPIQGTAADIMKRAMVNLDRALTETRSPARMTLQVHDELVLEVPDDALEATGRLVIEVMESVYPNMDPPLRANAESGRNWLEMRPLFPNRAR